MVFFGDAAVVTGSSKPGFAAHVNEVVRCVGGVKRIRPTVRGVDAGQVVRWCGSPLGEVGMGCQRLRQALACMCGRGPGGACGHAAPALDAACAEVVVFEALHVIDGGPGGGGTRGHDRWSLWPVVAAGISWSYNTFVFWASLAAAASVLKSWCRQRVTFACGVVAGNV